MRLRLSDHSATGYVGVSKKPWGAYEAQIRLGGRKKITLGSFPTAVEAARAYAKARAEVGGGNGLRSRHQMQLA